MIYLYQVHKGKVWLRLAIGGSIVLSVVAVLDHNLAAPWWLLRQWDFSSGLRQVENHQRGWHRVAWRAGIQFYAFFGISEWIRLRRMSKMLPRCRGFTPGTIPSAWQRQVYRRRVWLLVQADLCSLCTRATGVFVAHRLLGPGRSWVDKTDPVPDYPFYGLEKSCRSLPVGWMRIVRICRYNWPECFRSVS